MRIQNLGLIPYDQAWKKQLELVEERAQNEIPDTLLIVEHSPVITLGKKSLDRTPREIQGVSVFPVERGGEATFHGLGQIVMYPIFFLGEKLGPKDFLRLMEEAIIEALELYGISSHWIEGKTGVWLKEKEKKIASLGVAVRKNVSYHGLALNVSTDLKYFHLIEPCGFSPSVMTNMKEVLGREISLLEVADCLSSILMRKFQERFR